MNTNKTIAALVLAVVGIALLISATVHIYSNGTFVILVSVATVAFSTGLALALDTFGDSK